MRRKIAKMLMGAVMTLLFVDSTFAWWSIPRWMKARRANWIIIRNPVTALPVPILLPYESRSMYEFKNRVKIREVQAFERMRSFTTDRTGFFSRPKVRVRRPKP